jgi:hypothetical protein
MYVHQSHRATPPRGNLQRYVSILRTTVAKNVAPSNTCDQEEMPSAEEGNSPNPTYIPQRMSCGGTLLQGNQFPNYVHAWGKPTGGPCQPCSRMPRDLMKGKQTVVDNDCYRTSSIAVQIKDRTEIPQLTIRK